MTLLVDNDILHKLVALNLLSEALQLLNTTEDDIRILPTARYKFRLNKPDRGRVQYGDVFDKLADLIPRLQEISEASNGIEDRLSGRLALDPGEVLLVSAAVASPDSLFLTGDKRCIRALTEHQDLADICEALAGRVWCLEAIIGGIVKRHGFDFVRDRVVRNGYRDTAIRSAFGSGLQATPSVVHEALRLYLDDLHSCAGDMLAGLPLPDFDY